MQISVVPNSCYPGEFHLEERTRESIAELTQTLTDTQKLLTGKAYEDLILNGEFSDSDF